MGSVTEISPLHRDNGLPLFTAASSVALAVPFFFGGTYLPLLDLPQHLGTIAILAGGAPEQAFDVYYETRLLATPFLLPLLAAAALATERTVAVVALPAATAYALKSFGRDPRSALLAAPLGFGAFLYMGFLYFCLSLPLLMLYLGWWRRRCGAESFGPRDWSAGVVLGLLLFSAHVMTFGFACGAALLIALCARGPGSELEGSDDGERSPGASLRALGASLKRAGHLLPGLAVFVAWVALSQVAERGDLGRMEAGAMADEAPEFRAPLVALRAWPDWFLSVYRGDADEGLALAWLTLFAVFAVARRSSGAAKEGLAERLPALMLIAAVALYFALPFAYRGIYPISARMTPIAALLVLLVPRGRLVAPRAALWVGLALSLATAAVHTGGVRVFQPEVGPLADAVEEIRPGSRVMTLILDRDSEVMNMPVFVHFGQYAVAARGGVAELSMVNFTKSPVRYVERQAPPRLPARFEWSPHLFDFTKHGRYFDYFLVREEVERSTEVLFGTGADEVRRAGRYGHWTLYRRTLSTAGQSL